MLAVLEKLIKILKHQRLREVAQKARMESENLENVLKQKQTELDLSLKEMESLRMETDLQKKRVDEASHYKLLESYIYWFIRTITFCYWLKLTITFCFVKLRETYRNIDVADYNRLKDEVRQLEVLPIM